MGVELIEACKEKDLDKLTRLIKSPEHREAINALYQWPGFLNVKGTVLNYACRCNTHALVKVRNSGNTRQWWQR